MKRAQPSLQPDANTPGLMVCDQGCRDQKDPYRLAPRPTERITIRFPRPDTNIDVDDNNLVTSPFGGQVLSPQQNTQTPQNNGNFDNLTRQF